MHLKLHAPATPEQRQLANRLNVAYPSNITQGELHLLIDKASPQGRKQPRPTQGQVGFARRLGLEFDEQEVTTPYLKALIDEALVQISARYLREHPEVKVNAIIRFEGKDYRVRTIGPVLGEPWRMRLIPLDGGSIKLIYVVDLACPRVS